MVAIPDPAAGSGLEQMGIATTWLVLHQICQDAHAYMTMHMQQNEVVAFTFTGDSMLQPQETDHIIRQKRCGCNNATTDFTA